MQPRPRAVETDQSQTERTATVWWSVMMGREEEVAGELRSDQELKLKTQRHKQKISVILRSARETHRCQRSRRAKQAPVRWKNSNGHSVLTAAPATGTALQDWRTLSELLLFKLCCLFTHMFSLTYNSLTFIFNIKKLRDKSQSWYFSWWALAQTQGWSVTRACKLFVVQFSVGTHIPCIFFCSFPSKLSFRHSHKEATYTFKSDSNWHQLSFMNDFFRVSFCCQFNWNVALWWVTEW